MDALARQLLEHLDRGESAAELLARVGEPEPATASAAFQSAVRHPDLAASRGAWVAALLRTARPGFGARGLEELAGRRRQTGGAPLDPRAAPALPAVLGSSNFLARRLLRHPERVALVQGDPPDAPCEPVKPDWAVIRHAKYDGLLRIAARDLLGRPFPDGLRELSDLADACLAAALDCAAQETGGPPPALFALGKLGGRELNFSSDVDLLFLSDAPPDVEAGGPGRGVVELIRHLKRELESPAEDGFAYRVDLDLRPEGRAGVLVNSVDAAVAYYETFGQEWERQMLIRLRPVAGPVRVADAFQEFATPFVYRRLIDPGVLDAVRAMKARIEDERRQAGRDVDANLKEGRGGIRDVEFFVQSLQLFYGARHAELRTGNVIDSLHELTRLGLLPETTAAALVEAYTWLRRAEHAVQLPEEQQTAAFPREPRAQIALARRMGYDDVEGETARERLLEDWTAVRAEVRAHFDALVLRSDA